MQKYSYSIRLRIWHPSVNPDVITKTLQIKPNNTFVVGAPRRTPKGGFLEGNYRKSYWSANPFNIREYSSNDSSAEDTLTAVVQHLEPHASFFRKISNDGGRVLLEICSHGENNYAFIFPPELLTRCATTNLSLVLDVYQVPQNW